MIPQRFIEDIFYNGYGEIVPSEICLNNNAEYIKSVASFGRSEDWLVQRLEGDKKSHLINLINRADEIVGEASLANFVLGFRMGIKLVLDIESEDVDAKMLDMP